VTNDQLKQRHPKQLPNFARVVLAGVHGDDPVRIGGPLEAALINWRLNDIPRIIVPVVASSPIDQGLEDLALWLDGLQPRAGSGDGRGHLDDKPQSAAVLIFASPRAVHHVFCQERTAALIQRSASFLIMAGVGQSTLNTLAQQNEASRHRLLETAGAEGIVSALDHATRLAAGSNGLCIAAAVAQGGFSSRAIKGWVAGLNQNSEGRPRSAPRFVAAAIHEIHRLSPLPGVSEVLRTIMQSNGGSLAFVCQSAATANALLDALVDSGAGLTGTSLSSPWGCRIVIFPRGRSTLEALRSRQLPEWIETCENYGMITNP
jgi:hypothetical protein